MERNIYDLMQDFSKEAEEFILTWSQFGKYNADWKKRTPRERLKMLEHALKGEEKVLDFLNKKYKNEWDFSDKKRMMINNKYCPKTKPDLINTNKNITCEVKEVADKYWNCFGDQEFVLCCSNDDIDHYCFHDADYVIVINTSHNKIAELDKTKVRNIGNGFFKVSTKKVVDLEE